MGWDTVQLDGTVCLCRRGYGAQRRGGVFDRLSRDNGSGYSRYGGGRFARGRGRGGRGRGDFADGEPRCVCVWEWLARLCCCVMAAPLTAGGWPWLPMLSHCHQGLSTAQLANIII